MSSNKQEWIAFNGRVNTTTDSNALRKTDQLGKHRRPHAGELEHLRRKDTPSRTASKAECRRDRYMNTLGMVSAPNMMKSESDEARSIKSKKMAQEVST